MNRMGYAARLMRTGSIARLMRTGFIARLMRAGATLGLGLGLAACDGGDAAPSVELSVIKFGQAAIAEKFGPKVTPPTVTRALLDTLEGAYLEVALERHDLLAYLQITSERRDSYPGRLVTWRTVDNITLTMRNGVLVTTRGMGGDLLSSAVQVSGDRPGPARGGEKIMTLRHLDNKATDLVLACDLADLGSQTIEIYEHRHATRHLRETCTGGISGDAILSGANTPGTVVNDYWVDSRSGLVWQSRQWAGPGIGYLRTRRLTR